MIFAGVRGREAGSGFGRCWASESVSRRVVGRRLERADGEIDVDDDGWKEEAEDVGK